MKLHPPVAALLDEAATGRRFHGLQQERKQSPTEAVDALLDVFRRNGWPAPTVVLVGRPTDVHQRPDGVIVRVAGANEPKIAPGEFWAEIRCNLPAPVARARAADRDQPRRCQGSRNCQ